MIAESFLSIASKNSHSTEQASQYNALSEYLIQAFSGSVAVKNSRGFLPFHEALRSRAFVHAKCLLRANPLVALADCDREKLFRCSSARVHGEEAGALAIWDNATCHAHAHLHALRPVHQRFYVTMGLPEDMIGEIWHFLVPEGFCIALQPFGAQFDA